MELSNIYIYIYIYDSLEIMNQTMDIDVTPDFEINFMSPSHCFQVVLYAFDLPLPDGQWKKLGSFARRTAPSDALVVAVGPLAKRQRSQYDQPWHRATPTRPPGDESMAAPVILWPNSGNACGGEISLK